MRLVRVPRRQPAHRALFERYHARVAAFVRRRLHDAGLCEEVVSDVFFEIWRGASAYRGESEVPSWIFGIAHFKALTARRFHAQRKRAPWCRPRRGVSEAGRRGGGPSRARDEVRRLLHAEGLPEATRRAEPRLPRGRSYQGSDALGISEAT
jgi:DNA-directed RNA polymerase specialized sigma24 family protein